MAIEDLYFARLDRTTPSFVRGRGRVEDLDLLVSSTAAETSASMVSFVVISTWT